MPVNTAPPRIVIIGAGFAGLYAAKHLRDAAAEVLVIDRRNHHLFQPLLYQVATAALNPSDIAAPIRSILRDQKNVTVLLGEARAIDRQTRTVRVGDEDIAYDYLIIATGATHSYFGHDDWARIAPGLKNLEDALEIRRRILMAFEMAEKERDAGQRAAWLTFVIVGGGPTGVELAGAVAEIAQHTLARDFRHFDPRDARVILVEGLDRVLQTYPPPLSRKAEDQLRALGVEVRQNARVTKMDETGVVFGEEHLSAHTILWAAGVKASPLGAALGVPLDRAGRVNIEATLTIPGDPRVYVVGDLSALEDRGRMVPGVCPAAIQEGIHAAGNVKLALRGRALRPFHYRDKGSLATIGRAAGVGEIGPFKLSGLIAWMAWLFIHILFLIGFRNRLFVMIQWAWAYVTYQRGARLITSTQGDET
ncbi:MAG TPA: NAD(P)/FAD-dependent oxidoreductase [Thermoanaerobaculia bacterium]|nr:NAD(P)/FAD-dependent oxidoreductase [Thermoanaerobaculia bacterium]